MSYKCVLQFIVIEEGLEAQVCQTCMNTVCVCVCVCVCVVCMCVCCVCVCVCYFYSLVLA